jgi:putative ABC transport system permease protein
MRSLNVVLHLFGQSSRLARKRAFLTIAAITWGTVSIVLLLSFGEGLKLQLSKNRRAMGERIAVMWPGSTTKPWKGMPPGRPIRLTVDDVHYLRERVPELEAAIGEMQLRRTSLSYGTKTVAGRVFGANWEYGEVRKHYPKAGGRFFGPGDEAEKRRVIFLGDELAKDIFGKEDPVGKLLLVNGTPFTVIGVMQHKTQMGMYSGPDSKHAMIPLTTAKAMSSRDTLNVFLIQVRRPDEMAAMLRRVNEVFGAKYGYDPADTRVLGTWDTVKSNQATANMSLGIELFLGIIGVLTLLIGGIGVANIMYAVVRERTREIGVKMALGARPAWITAPFVLEGLTYTFVGGAAGMFIAIVLVTLLGFLPMEGNKVLEFLGKPTISPVIGIGTSAVLGLIGLLAGYFPARRAAAVDPAATLRYE